MGMSVLLLFKTLATGLDECDLQNFVVEISNTSTLEGECRQPWKQVNIYCRVSQSLSLNPSILSIGLQE